MPEYNEGLINIKHLKMVKIMKLSGIPSFPVNPNEMSILSDLYWCWCYYIYKKTFMCV